MKKNFLAILFILMLTAPFLGSVIFIKFQKNAIKNEVKNYLLKNTTINNLYKITLSTKDAKNLINWKSNYEFEYQNKMFDVAKSEIKKDSISFWCLQDFKETELNKKTGIIVNILLGNNQTNKNNQNNFISFLNNLFFTDILKWKFHINQSKLNDFNILVFFMSQNISPLTPPPKLF
ncbi:MAG: hypothetical protein JXR68_10875 [Bacteroidales bacterium]|nr:hypothetical protein [Bacteroidales bacterium]